MCNCFQGALTGEIMEGAATKGLLRVIKHLIQEKKVPVDSTCNRSWGETALILAAKHGHLECVKFLVESGCSLHEKGTCNP